MSNWTTASVAAVHPPIAVRTMLPDSIASTTAAIASDATVLSCHPRRCNVSSSAAGVSAITPNTTPTPSSRRSRPLPNPSGPSESSCVERTVSQSTATAASAAHAPAAATTRAMPSPKRDVAAATTAAATGSAIGASSATGGTR